MQYNKQTRRLTADANKWLTFDNQIFFKTVSLAVSLTPEDVQEVTDEEKQEIEAAINEEIKEE